MQDRNRIDLTLRRRFHLRALPICLIAGWLSLTGAGWAQTDPTPETAPSEALEDPQDESLDQDSSLGSCPGCGQRRGQGQGRGCRGKGNGRGQGKGQGGQGEGWGQGQTGRRGGCQTGDCQRPEAQVIHFLIDNHQSLERTVEEIPGGVQTRTISQDPEIVDAVRTHVRQMVDLIHGQGRIRNWDPLFREIFDRREAIEMEISDIEGGVEVREISGDAEVTKLIRAHAIKVEEFVVRGLEAYQENTPLPEGYADTSP